MDFINNIKKTSQAQPMQPHYGDKPVMRQAKPVAAQPMQAQPVAAQPAQPVAAQPAQPVAAQPVAAQPAQPVAAQPMQAQPAGEGLEGLQSVIQAAKSAGIRDFITWEDVTSDILFFKLNGQFFLHKVTKDNATNEYINYQVEAAILVSPSGSIVRNYPKNGVGYRLMGSKPLNKKIEEAVAAGYTHAMLTDFHKTTTKAGRPYNAHSFIPCNSVENAHAVTFYEQNIITQGAV